MAPYINLQAPNNNADAWGLSAEERAYLYSNQSVSYVPSTGTTFQSSAVQAVWDQEQDQAKLDMGVPTLMNNFRTLRSSVQGRDTTLRLDSANAPPFNPASYASSNPSRQHHRDVYDELTSNMLGLGIGPYDGSSDQPTMNGWNPQPRGRGIVSDTRPRYQQLNAGRGQASGGQSSGRRQFDGDGTNLHLPAYNTHTLDWQSAQSGYTQLQAPYLPHFNRAAGHARGHTPVESQLEQYMDLKLKEYLQLYARDKKRCEAYTLEKIRGSVVSFCMQQTGSRFIQNELAKANTKERDLVFNEMYDELLRLSEDQSGNYVVQKIIECGTQLQKTAILNVLKGKLGQLAKNNQASRVVQRLLEKILVSEQHIVLDDMRSVISDLCRHKNGHHLVLVALNTVENRGQLDFIFDSVRGKVLEHARDENGCMVLQTMLEKGTEHDRDFICAELRVSYQELCTHAKGNFVVQKILEHCRPELRNKLVQVIIDNVVPLSKAKSGSHVVEKLYSLGITVDQRHAIVNKLMGFGSIAYKELCLHQYGNYVIRTILIDLGKFEPAFLKDIWQTVYGFLQVAVVNDGKTKKAIDALIDKVNDILSTAPRSPSQGSSSPLLTPDLTMEPNSPTSNSPSANDSALDELFNTLPHFTTQKAYKPSPYTNGVKHQAPMHYK